MTSDIARDFALAMHPVLSEAYARGTAVRRVSRHLGPAELFQADSYDGSAHAYRGVFIDLAALATDLAMEHAGATLQALYLATLLETEHDTTAILLSTDACTKGAKPGARTYKRPTFVELQRLMNALGGLAHRAPTPNIPDALPRADVIAFLRARADQAKDDDARALFQLLEGNVSMPDRPRKGPLSDPELWAVESRIENGELKGTVEAIDELEQRIGRTPGTTYLRARVSLALHLEPPKLIAERVSALALSMTSFQELGLLAAESWLEAGDPRRAMPYARDLVDAPGIEEGLRLRAERLLARATGTAPQRRNETRTDFLSAPQPSRPPAHADEIAAEMANVLAADPMLAGRRRSSLPSRTAPTQPPASSGSRIPHLQDLTLTKLPSLGSPDDQLEGTQPGRALPAIAPPPRLSPPPPIPPPRLSPPPPNNVDAAASFTLDLPGPDQPRTEPPGSRRPRISGVMMETRPPASADPRAEPDTPILPRDGPGASSAFPRREPASGAAVIGRSVPAPPRSGLPPVSPPGGKPFMHGASLPPYRHEDPAPLLPKAPLFPKLSSGGDELAEHLALPPGIGAEPRALDVLPTSVLEARIQFTLLSRELGLDYRLKRGIDLRADLSGIEAMQAVLLESFPDHVVHTPDEAYELRRHGALLSEILARRLDAEWLDISPNELGYWVMIVPPDTRVWPFGRVVRLVAMGHKERDLVSYFLELQGRARGR
jgi:hypothetical protein